MLRQFAKRVVSAAPVLRPLAAHVDCLLTGHKNLLYDERTVAILRRVCQPNSNVVDIGTHEAELLRTVLEICPQGQHYAFEPLPELAGALRRCLPAHVTVCEFALGDSEGQFSFLRNLTDSARSGLRRTRFDADQKVEQLRVQVKRLDDVLPREFRVNVIKIDVEGAEYLVLCGAVDTLRRCHPVIIFEHGMGGSDEAYGHPPEEVYELLSGLQYNLFTLKQFLDRGAPLSAAAFAAAFRSQGEYYFVASATGD